MAIVARWGTRRLTLDGSASIANAVFIQSERDFDGKASWDDIKRSVLDDELQLFKLLSVEEVAP